MSPSRLPSGAIARPALVQRLREGRGRALTLVSAPAGYGKSTLLAEWVTADPSVAVAWVSLDRRDTDPTRLWLHLIASLALVEPRAGTESLAALRERPDQIEEHSLPLLLDELGDDGPDLVLVLDDLHLARSARVDALVEAFMRYRPARVQLVVSTRADPALGIARLRASGDLLEVRAEDLRFDQREVSLFLDGIGVDGLSRDDERRLAQRTGGWPAPLRLLALLIPDRDRGAFIESFTGGHRPVVDYLTNDVLALLEPDVQEFVLRVSILTRMCGPLCDAVVGGSGSGALLAELERANLFLSVDTAGTWYHQHQLFAGALRLELGRTRPDLVPALHLRAAQWYEEAGDLESAVGHAIESRDLAVATRLVAAEAQQLASSGRWATVRGWLDELSWPEARADPELAYIRATAASFVHDIDGAEGWLDVASTGDPDLVGAMGLPLGYRTDFLRAIVGINDVTSAERSARRALQFAPGPQWEGVALAGLGQAHYLRGRIAEAEQTLRRAVGLIPDANPNLLAFAIGSLALAEYAEDGAGHAGPMLDGALAALRATGQDRSPLGAVVHLACGERERTAGDPVAAVRWCESAIEILGTESRSAWLANAYLLHAVACRAGSDTVGELRSLDAADAVLARLPDPGALPARSARLRQESAVIVRHVTEFGETLSEREISVLLLAADGLTQREIAEQLFISYNTVKSHLKATYRKLGATSRDDALTRLAELVPAPRTARSR